MSMLIFFFFLGGGGGGGSYMDLVPFDNDFKQMCTYVCKNMEFRIVM